MQTSDRAIVRFSFACLALFVVAGLFPIAFPDSLMQDGAALPPEVPATLAADSDSQGGHAQVVEACGAALSTCDGTH